MKILLFKRPTLIGLLLPFLFQLADPSFAAAPPPVGIYYNIYVYVPRRVKKSKAISPFCILSLCNENPPPPIPHQLHCSTWLFSFKGSLLARLIVQLCVYIIYTSPRGAFKCIIIYVYTMILLTSPFRYYIIYIHTVIITIRLLF